MCTTTAATTEAAAPVTTVPETTTTTTTITTTTTTTTTTSVSEAATSSHGINHTTATGAPVAPVQCADASAALCAMITDQAICETGLGSYTSAMIKGACAKKCGVCTTTAATRAPTQAPTRLATPTPTPTPAPTPTPKFLQCNSNADCDTAAGHRCYEVNKTHYFDNTNKCNHFKDGCHCRTNSGDAVLDTPTTTTGACNTVVALIIRNVVGICPSAVIV